MTGGTGQGTGGSKPCVGPCLVLGTHKLCADPCLGGKYWVELEVELKGWILSGKYDVRKVRLLGFPRGN